MAYLRKGYFTGKKYFSWGYFDLGLLTQEQVLPTKRLLGFLLQPYCHDNPRYNFVILAIDPELRDYIYLSQTFPHRLSSLEDSPPIWSALNLGNPDEESPISITVTVPDYPVPLEYEVEQDGSEVLLGVRPPYEYGLVMELSGQVIGAIYADIPESPPEPLLPPPPLPPPLPPLPSGPPVHDSSWPPDYVWSSEEFLYPSQAYKFYPWYYQLYSGEDFPLLDQIPYLRVH